MDEMKIYLTAPPDFVSDAARRGPVSAQGWRIGRDLRLYRWPLPEARIALMDVDAGSFTGYGPHEALVNALICQCRRAGYRGLVPDLPRPNERLLRFCALLDRAAARFGLELYLPERYARAAPGACVLVQAQNASGTYEERLRRLSSLYGADRLALELERVTRDFPLPCRSGLGRVLSPGETADLPPLVSRFSPELCANTASYMKDGRAHLLLWDDADTLGRKMDAARRLGIGRMFFYYPHVEDIIEKLL